MPYVRHALAASLLLAGSGAAAEPQRFEIDPEHFSVVFNANHMGYASPWGMFLRGRGEFVYDHEAREVSDLSVEIEADSVFSNSDRRDGHLRSAEFLDAQAHPLITFEMTGAEADSETTGRITGDLTLRGETHPVTLDVTLNKYEPYPWGDNVVLGISARTTLQRSRWGMTYALQNDMVADEIPIIIELEAIRQDG